MDLRKSHETPQAFDAFLVGVALFGAFVAWRSFAAGGAWDALGLAALVGECLLAWGCFIEPRRITIKRYREALVTEPKAWVRLVFLSDLHAGDFKPASWYAKVVEKAKTLDADILISGGDLVVDANGPIVDLESFKTLRGKIGTYYVMGNHDLVDRPQGIREALETWGFTCIEDKVLRLEKDGRVFDLAGVSDPWFGDPVIPRRRATDIPHVTISHEPDLLMDLQKGDTDLMLSGHTHGGQVRLPLIGSLYPIPCKLGRRVDRGRKTVNGVTCIISQGLGESDGRIRLFAPPQIICVEIGI